MKRVRKEYPGEIPVPKKLEAARAVIAREKTQADLAEEFGVSRQAVHQWVQLYRLGLLDKARSGRGRPKIRNLTADEGRKIKAIIVKNTPEQAGFDARFKRWDYEVTRRLIARETGVKMTYRIVAEHMERWRLPHGPNIPKIEEEGAGATVPPKHGEGAPEAEEAGKSKAAPAPPVSLPEFPRKKRGRPRKVEKPKAAGSDVDVDVDEVDDAEDFIDYDAEVEKSRQFLNNLKRHAGGGFGKHAKQRRKPFQPGKKKKKRK